jgi:hypothetical protein
MYLTVEELVSSPVPISNKAPVPLSTKQLVQCVSAKRASQVSIAGRSSALALYHTSFMIKMIPMLARALRKEPAKERQANASASQDMQGPVASRKHPVLVAPAMATVVAKRRRGHVTATWAFSVKLVKHECALDPGRSSTRMSKKKSAQGEVSVTSKPGAAAASPPRRAQSAPRSAVQSPAGVEVGVINSLANAPVKPVIKVALVNSSPALAIAVALGVANATVQAGPASVKKVIRDRPARRARLVRLRWQPGGTGPCISPAGPHAPTATS